ncbi:hypothetical protein AO069_03410 [Pseudomonas syringae pv. syringae PD2774]|nr:hypothetical protein AO069_03410 [Pseudomonas syringae pv. syringae PD2774]KWS23034.1 hypothetical protein AL061_22590 [Pseudomonas syringae pv. syringae]
MGEARHCRQATPGAVSDNTDTTTVKSQFFGVIKYPTTGSNCVLRASRERMLRRKPIIYGYHNTATRVGKPATNLVMGVKAADDPTAAMKVDQSALRIAIHS